MHKGDILEQKIIIGLMICFVMGGAFASQRDQALVKKLEQKEKQLLNDLRTAKKQAINRLSNPKIDKLERTLTVLETIIDMTTSANAKKKLIVLKARLKERIENANAALQTQVSNRRTTFINAVVTRWNSIPDVPGNGDAYTAAQGVLNQHIGRIETFRQSQGW